MKSSLARWKTVERTQLRGGRETVRFSFDLRFIQVSEKLFARSVCMTRERPSIFAWLSADRENSTAILPSEPLGGKAPGGGGEE